MSPNTFRSRFACFVTGTDTGVGKTHATAALLQALARSGRTTLGMKPVASGCEWRDGQWHNEDVDVLRAAGTEHVPPELTCPYLLRTPCSPHLAAVADNTRIEPAPILAAFATLQAAADAVVVEGVGGFRVPLAMEAAAAAGTAGTADTANPVAFPAWDTADLARMLGLPVVLVVGIRLGCLNHALLTAEAVQARGLRLAGWIANQIDPDMALADENIATLDASLSAPRLGTLPWGTPPADAAACLDLTPLLAADPHTDTPAASAPAGHMAA
ncbi:dethiobiotin synthetase [Cupriavidus gilardii J11]|uniref:ATP-dependent dethiobiotin synthetase BioD n=1 Tax=Cupriavidus gilardii J11 TaxID=936133 RepID=A0A562BAQ6_9BURK|nr:dethiobiotin synthase [Cupriavidus gilardii]TWG82243.1 dethiobiotin synthetase [Cupriavidus gilardii J11]